MSTGRYNHWFWNSNFMLWVSRKIGRLSTWVWYMQYGRKEAKNQ
mgnify:CR=1 FL=1